MKTCLTTTILLALVVATSLSAAQVGSIRLAQENGATVARIEVDGPFQFTHSTEVPKDGKPDRLIVDIIGASHSWGPKEWNSLPQCIVSKLRIGQYSSKPEKVVRVVFELTKAPVYQAELNGKSIVVRLNDSSAKPFAAWSTGPAPTVAPVVPNSTATPTVTEQKSSPAVAANPKVDEKASSQPTSHSTLAQQPPLSSKPAQPITSTQSPTPAPKPTVATDPSTKPSATVATSEPKSAVTSQPNAATSPAKSVDVKPTSTVATADNKAATPGSSVPNTKPAVVESKSEPKSNATIATTPAKPSVAPPQPTVQKPSEVTPKIEAKSSPTVASTPAKPTVNQNQQSGQKPADVTPKAEAKPSPSVAAQSSATPSKTPVAETKPTTPVVAQSNPKVENKGQVAEAKPSTHANAAKPDQLVKAEQFKGASTPVNQPSERPAVTNSGDKPTPAVASTANQPSVKTDNSVVASNPTEAKFSTPVEAKPVEKASEQPSSTTAKVAAPDKPKFAEADDATGISTPASQTARFRRSATASARMKSSLVAEFPQRLVIKYEDKGYRDPFATLIDDTRTYDTPVEKRLANVEGLRLVGILENASGSNRALFQDKRNFSYMLKAGDKVEKGYVLRVETDKVYFQIFEYGWSRTVALTFDNRD